MADAASEGSNRTPSDARDDDNRDRPRKARRTFLTQNACRRCRQKKSKCDGKRPQCSRCMRNAAECVYDVAQEGLTRMQSLQQRVEESEANLRQVTALIDALRSGTDGHASNLLARLRLGEDIETLTTFMEPPSGEDAFGREEMRESQHEPDVRTLSGWVPPHVPSQGSWTPWDVHGALSSHGGEPQPDGAPMGASPYPTPERMAGPAVERRTHRPDDGEEYPPRDAYHQPDPSRYFEYAHWQRARGEEQEEGRPGSSARRLPR